MVTRSDKLATIGPSLADLVLEVFCFAASPSVKGVATLVAKARQAVNDVGTSSPKFVRDRSMLSKRIIEVLTKKVKAAREQCLDRGIDASLLVQAESAVAALISTDAEEDLVVLSAVRDPEGFIAFFMTRAAKHRQQIEEQSEPYFDALVRAVAATYVEIAPWSDSFVVAALTSLLDEFTGMKEQMTIHHMEDRQLFDQIIRMIQSLTEAIENLSKPSHAERVNFGSRPDVVAGDRFIERGEQEQLNSLIADPTQQRTVLVGMRGCGKTQLASTLAQQCEDAHWSLVAWVNASSTESITSDLVELAKELKKELKIETSDQPTPKTIIRRLFNRLKSADPSDRLIVFDNVEDINHLTGLVPSGDGVRVVATTTNKVGWEDQGWNSIKVGVFDRSESINYLLMVTKSDDRDAADALAERLGDLPLAIAQAAATARNGNLSLVQYLDRLDSYRSERVIRPVPGDYYTDDVATALCMAIEYALENLEDETKQAAQRQLAALALLAESGVPTRWLDPIIKQQDNREVQDTNRADGDSAHDALTELSHRSIVQQSADKTTTALHRLQAQVLRESWTEKEHRQACESATNFLAAVDIETLPKNATDSLRTETRNLIEQLRSIGEHEYSRVMLNTGQIRSILKLALVHARECGLVILAITLQNTVDAVEEILGTHHSDVLELQNELAGAYRAAGSYAEAIAMYRKVVAERTLVLGEEHADTLSSLSSFAAALKASGDLTEATKIYQQVLDDRTRLLGKDHPKTLTSRNNLAAALKASGNLTEATKIYQQVLDDRTRLLGKDHPKTLTSRNNLAAALKAAGQFTEAIALHEQTLSGRKRVLGRDHPKTLMSQDKLAEVYQSVGDLTKAISLREELFTSYLRAFGSDHPLTVTAGEKLEAARRELAQRNNDSHTDGRGIQV